MPLEHGETPQECVVIHRDVLTDTARLSEALAAAGWQVTLSHDGAILEIVAVKRHHSLRAAVDELLAFTASGCVYLDAPDLCSTLYYADLARPDQHYPVEAEPDARQR